MIISVRFLRKVTLYALAKLYANFYSVLICCFIKCPLICPSLMFNAPAGEKVTKSGNAHSSEMAKVLLLFIIVDAQ